MRNGRSICFIAMAAVAMPLLLSDCGGGNSALLASGGPEDFATMGRISDQYGREPDSTVPLAVGEEQYSYRIWISKDGHRIMAQTASMTGAAAAGFVRGLTGGLVKGEQDFEPFRQAAETYLAQARGEGCALHNSRKLSHVGWEWDFECRRG